MGTNRTDEPNEAKPNQTNGSGSCPPANLKEMGWKNEQPFSAEDDPDRTKMPHEVPSFVRRDPAKQRGKLKITHLDVSGVANDNELEGTVAVVVDNVLLPEDCQALIAMCNAKGFTPALLNSGGGYQVYLPNHRRGWRCIVDCPALATYLLEVLRPVLPMALGTGDMVDINERCRYLFYEQGQKFEPHYDGCYTRPKDHPTEEKGRRCKSRLTLQIYLNDVPTKCGGATTFLGGKDEDEKLPCQPKAGSVLVFSQNLLHEGSVLLNGGAKYTMRSEVMYRPRPAA